MVPRTEELLLENDPDVLGLFAGSPFPHAPPHLVRAVLWQYWFSTMQEKRTSGVWWRRQLIGPYAPTITKLPNNHFQIIEDSTLNGGARRPDAP
jgi:lipase maturation factor 1